MQGCYDIRAFRGRAINVVSNKPAGQPFRGVARPLSCIGHEIVMDGVAQAVGIDPLDVRLRNFVKPEQMPYVSITKKTLDSGDYAAALKRAAELIDLPALRARQKPREPDGRLIGVGFASFYEQTAYGTGPFGYSAWGIELVPGMEPAVARLTGDGELVLEVGSHSHGQGHETVFAQVAHEVLGIDPRKVIGALRRHLDLAGRHRHLHVALDGDDRRRDRRSLPRADGADLQDRRASPAMQRSRCRRSGTAAFTARKAASNSRRSAAPGTTIPKICRRHGCRPVSPPPPATSRTIPACSPIRPMPRSLRSIPRPAKSNVVDYAIVADCGTRVNPLLVEGQVLGGFSNGLGNALYEESTYDALGQPTATTLADYTAPTAPSVPRVKLDFIETPSPFSMFGMKGIGENGAIGPPAAIVNAVNDALRPLGAAVFETPVTPLRVRKAIARARNAG